MKTFRIGLSKACMNSSIVSVLNFYLIKTVFNKISNLCWLIFLLGDSKNTEKGFTAFKDIYNEIVNYYQSLNEPLLTADLSYLFIFVFEKILLLKPAANPAAKFPPTQPKDTDKPSIRKPSNQSPTILLIEELIDNLKSQLNEQQREKSSSSSAETSPFMPACSAHRLLSLISCPNKLPLRQSKPTNIIDETFESIENKLIEEAQLPIWFLMDNLQTSAVGGNPQTDESFLNDLHYLLNSSGAILTNEQKEVNT